MCRPSAISGVLKTSRAPPRRLDRIELGKRRRVLGDDGMRELLSPGTPARHKEVEVKDNLSI
jgi:hypothetical protein